MNPGNCFFVVNAIILIGWLPLFFAPRWKLTHWLMDSFILPLILAVIYILLNVLNFGRAPGGFFTLEQVSQLFNNRALLLAGWVHIGALDLFVGYWETKDAQRSGVHHLLLLPCLVLTLFFGPAGLLSYFIVRRATGCKTGGAL